MKKFLVIASSVAVIAAGAGVGTYLFFQGHGRKIAAPVAKAPLKKAPAAGAKKDAVPPEKPAATTQALPAEKTAAAGPPSPKKVAKSKPETAPEGAKKESYSVQVGAFHNEGNAAALAGKLKKKGYDAFVLNDAGRQVHRVLIGKFGSSGAAAAEAKRLLEREDLKSIIYRH